MITTRFQPPMVPSPPQSPSSRSRNSSRKNSISDRYIMGDKIGEGSFGIVYRATNKKSGALVCCCWHLNLFVTTQNAFPAKYICVTTHTFSPLMDAHPPPPQKSVRSNRSVVTIVRAIQPVAQPSPTRSLPGMKCIKCENCNHCCDYRITVILYNCTKCIAITTVWLAL